MKVRVPGMRLLAAWMKRNGLTQEACGARFGVTGVAVSLWLSGARRPNIDSAMLIEEGTGRAVPASAWRKPARLVRRVPRGPSQQTPHRSE